MDDILQRVEDHLQYSLQLITFQLVLNTNFCGFDLTRFTVIIQKEALLLTREEYFKNSNTLPDIFVHIEQK